MNGKTPSITTLASKVGIIYSDAKREYFPTEQQYITEKDAYDDAQKTASILSAMGIEAKLYPGNDTLIEHLKADKPDMVFNLVDSVKGNEYLSSTIPGILDTMDIPYTGAGLLGMAINYNKFLTLDLLKQAGVPVPNSQLFNTPTDQISNDLRYPLISKLNEIHGAVEISTDSVSETEKHLRDRLKFLISTYNQPVLVEEFISGREITAMVLEGMNSKIYLAEKVFNKPNEKYSMATFSDQWVADEKSQGFTYAKFEDDNLKELVKKAFDISRFADYGKFDIRLDASGRCFFIDANTNPAFGPKELGTAMGYIIEGLYGVPFPEILQRLIKNTLASA